MDLYFSCTTVWSNFEPVHTSVDAHHFCCCCSQESMKKTKACILKTDANWTLNEDVYIHALYRLFSSELITLTQPLVELVKTPWSIHKMSLNYSQGTVKGIVQGWEAVVVSHWRPVIGARHQPHHVAVIVDADKGRGQPCCVNQWGLIRSSFN